MRRPFPLLALAVLLGASTVMTANGHATDDVQLLPAPAMRLPGAVDSNSPIIRALVDGKDALFVMTSFAGRPSTATGPTIAAMSAAAPADVAPWPGGGVWMEAIVEDEAGTWYGYYHNEIVATAECGPKATKVVPRIGAARSVDHGATWESLGIILEAPPRTSACSTKNRYFVGGVGDLSVMLSPDSRDLYIFYSEYMKSPTTQGVAVARLAWADRDEPAGKVMVWRTRTWFPPSVVIDDDGDQSWSYPAGLPIFAPTQPWHDSNAAVDAFWGPSVHWNTYLNEYVMLLNRAKDESFGQEGIYVSYASRLDNPRLWSAPVKIYDGGSWYPQVIGDGPNGTDKVAGETARFFMSGTSEHTIRFSR
jgi:hypothetical protein